MPLVALFAEGVTRHPPGGVEVGPDHRTGIQAGDDAGVEKPKEKTAEEIAEEEAAAKKEAEETYAGYAEDVKADLIKTTMSLPEVKRVGYVLAGVDVPPVPTPAGPTEICAKLFTWIPPRPEMRLKPKPPPAEGEDAEGGAEEGAEEAAEEAAPVEEEPPPELPEESAEAAEARRCADPAASLTDVILLKIADDGRHAHSLKDKHPESANLRLVRAVCVMVCVSG